MNTTTTTRSTMILDYLFNVGAASQERIAGHFGCTVMTIADALINLYTAGLVELGGGMWTYTDAAEDVA